MKYLSVFLITLSLVACGGGSSNPKSSLGFSQEELANTIWISKSLLNVDTNRNIPLGAVEIEGSIDIFNTGGILREFPLTRENKNGRASGHAEYVDSPYTVLTDGQIQIDYAGLGICTTKKERESNTELDISGKCPSLSNLFDTVLKPLEFDSSFLQGKRISIQSGSTGQVFDFANDGTFEENPIFGAGLISGIFLDSKYKNVVRLNFSSYAGIKDHSLFFLVAGNLSSGKVVEIRYLIDDLLDGVYIHTVNSTGSWVTNNVYIN